MKKDKFSKFSPEDYYERYIEKSRNFYKEISKKMAKYLKGEKLVGLDIGTGPGIGAFLLNDAKVKAKVYGFEPSSNYIGGIKLGRNFEKTKQGICYVQRKGEIRNIGRKFKFQEESFDFILILRALHEIKYSLGGIKNLEKEIKRVMKFLKKGGFLIISDPQYSDKISANPTCYKKEIKIFRENSMKTLGHSHVPRDYVLKDNVKKILPKNFVEVDRKIVKKDKPLKNVAEFYILVFKKR